jgi:adiponectin receptor
MWSGRVFQNSRDGATSISHILHAHSKEVSHPMFRILTSIPSIMRTLTDPSRDGVQTLTWEQIPHWRRDNRHIVKGYPPGKAKYLATSLTFLHNETCNIYTHLIGALLLPIVAFGYMNVLTHPQFSGVSQIDYAMFGIFFLSAECCLVFSTTFHLVGSHSQDVEQFWLRMDLLGIVVVTVGTFVPGIYYAFPCQPSLQKLHWTVVSHLSNLFELRSSCL